MSSRGWIVAVAESRDRKAFKQLFDYFAPRIKGFCQNNGSTADQADEVVQEALSIFGERPIYLIRRKPVPVLGYLQSPEILELI